MILEETNKPHQKHAKLTRPDLGAFGRNELAIVGTTCANIKQLAYSIIERMPVYKIAYVDADHKRGHEEEANVVALTNGVSLEYTDKISFQRVDSKTRLNPFQNRTLFNEQHLVIVNGNHFAGRSQIVVVDPLKNLEKKIDQLTDVRLILLKEADSGIPDFLQKLPGINSVPVLALQDVNAISAFVRKFLQERVPSLHGLVLSGGQSSRMKKDKGSISYHGISQRQYLYDLLSKHCIKTFVSCNAEQAVEIGDTVPLIQDSFLKMGPAGGVLSALRTDPNAAWLVVACDLPYLSESTIKYLVEHRNPAKNATAFLDPDGQFPEPLVAIWEPRSYLTLLQFVGQGYSCPRKTLTNSDIELLTAPDATEFLNVNSPDQYEDAVLNLRKRRQGNNTPE
ncbi:MAG: NTP transferase domain-containing protein [Bacteroidota bacterium]|nr:NTP transferase domain-containing protein [Bacteroidota bacterium]